MDKRKRASKEKPRCWKARKQNKVAIVKRETGGEKKNPKQTRKRVNAEVTVIP